VGSGVAVQIFALDVRKAWPANFNLSVGCCDQPPAFHVLANNPAFLEIEHR